MRPFKQALSGLSAIIFLLTATLATPAAAPETPAPKPLRHRHEAFCQYFVLYGNATTAAIEAGYKSKWARNQGYRLGRQPVIRARIAEVCSMLSRDYCLDADVLLGKLKAVYQRAHENHHFHAAARAVEIQARIARQSWPAKQEQRTRGGDGVNAGDTPEVPGGPDREINMTTNDDISRPHTGGFAVNSMPYARRAGQK